MLKKSEMQKRVAVAVVAMPLIIAAAYLGKLYFLSFVSIVVIGSVIEFYRFFMKDQTTGSILSGTIAALAICFDLYFFDTAANA